MLLGYKNSVLWWFRIWSPGEVLRTVVSFLFRLPFLRDRKLFQQQSNIHWDKAIFSFTHQVNIERPTSVFVTYDQPWQVANRRRFERLLSSRQFAAKKVKLFKFELSGLFLSWKQFMTSVEFIICVLLHCSRYFSRTTCFSNVTAQSSILVRENKRVIENGMWSGKWCVI